MNARYNQITPGRILRAALFAGACAVLVATSAYVDFSGRRVRLARESVSAPPDGLRLPVSAAESEGLGAPFAVVANLTNGSSSAEAVSIRLDGHDVCAPIVPAGRSIRVDCQFAGPWDSAIDHQAELTSRAATWRLDAFELSTHHGSNASFVRLHVLPVASRAYGTSVFHSIVLSLLTFALLLVPQQIASRTMRIAHRTFVAIFLTWAAVVIAAPHVSSYRIIVSINTVMAWLAIALAPQIYLVAERPVREGASRLFALGPVHKVVISAAMVVACFALVVERRVSVEYGGNYSGMLVLAGPRVEAMPWLQERPDIKAGLHAPHTVGYDGQFMYAIAFDPFLRRFHDQPKEYEPFIDFPPYRYGRVGYPLIARTFSFGHPEFLPRVMVTTIYAGLFAAALGLGLRAIRAGAGRWWGLLIALVPGFWASCRGALPEPVALGAAIIGYFCVNERRYLVGAIFLAVACLIRETSVLLVVCLAGWLVWSKQLRHAVVVLAIALAPLALWRLYVGSVFEPVWGFQAYWNPPEDFSLPFTGIAALWSELANGHYYPNVWQMRRGAMAFSVLIIVAAAVSWAMVRSRPGPVTVAGAIFGTMAVCFNLKNVWVSNGNAERLTGDLFVCLALSTSEFVSRSARWRTTLITLWFALAVYTLFWTLDAEFNRESLLQILPWR